MSIFGEVEHKSILTFLTQHVERASASDTISDEAKTELPRSRLRQGRSATTIRPIQSSVRCI